MSAPNHYDILGLPTTASQEEIENRYRDLSRLYQIDGAASGQGMSSLIAEAGRVLSNPSLRAVYDSTLVGLASPAAAEGADDSGVPTGQAVESAVGMDRTQEVPAALSPKRDVELDRTVEVPRQAPAQVEDRQLAAELARRGIPPDEVRRLVELGKVDSTPAKVRRPLPPSAPVIPPSQFVPRPSISLPPIRESSPQDRIEADRLLTSANIARRRNKFGEAETLCKQAIELVPGDAAALELYGDVLQSTGRVDDAVIAYQRASEIDPARTSAERKYGDLVLRQDRSIAMIRDEYVPGNAHVAVLLSAVLPGAGQVYNGQALKGLVTAAAFLSVLYVIFYSPYGLPHQRDGVSTSLAMSIVVAGLVYIYAVVDANISARRGRLRGSGWEV